MSILRAVRAWVRNRHNIHFGSGYRGGYRYLSGGAELLALPEGFHFRKSDRPVQPPMRAAEPFYPDVNRPPLGFDALHLEVLDGLQVERTTIAEVQARPQSHPERVGEWRKSVPPVAVPEDE